MRIAIDANPLTRAARTGTEMYTLELLRALARQDSSNEYALYASTPVPPADLLLPPNFVWHYLAPARAWSHRRLGPAVKRARLDLLFIPAHVLPLGYRGRSVVTVHDVGHRRVPRAYRPGTWLYLEATTRWAARVATRLITVSVSTRDDLQRTYRVAASRITVIPEGVASGTEPAPPATVREVTDRYRLTDPYFLFVGTLQPRKNLAFLAQAFERTFAAGPPWLALAGQATPAAGALDRYPAVRRLGYAPRADLVALLTGATALVLPSHHEGFALPVVEAMACGAPVLAARVGALPEVLSSAGLLLPPRDLDAWRGALRSVWEDASLRRRLRDAGFRRAGDFDWSRAAAATLQVFRDACQAPAASRYTAT
jgi:glycosyltransferase involved in cell wall biosynthesis